MRQALRFALALVVGLALLTWGASVVVSRTTRAWFERDMLLRAELAVSGARETLVSHWASGQQAELRRALAGLTHDERVLGAAACGADLTPIAWTPDYPALLSCERLGPEVRTDADSPAVAWTTWASGYSVPGGQVHATAIPDRGGGAPPGLRGPRPRPELRRAARGDHATLPRAGLRFPGRRGLDRHLRRGTPVLARLEQRAAAADPGRAAAGRVPALPPGRPRPRRSARLGPGGRRPGGPVDGSAAQEHAEPAPPRRARGDRGEPRALHPRARRGRRRWRSSTRRAAS